MQQISRIQDNRSVIEELFLQFLSRLPSQQERDIAMVYLSKATTAVERNALIEDLAWICINKVEFLFSY
jgi:hypothetical protein